MNFIVIFGGLLLIIITVVILVLNNDDEKHTSSNDETSVNKSKKTKLSDNLNSATNKVIVEDINMPFGSMVMFMIKLALASIPAFIILGIIGILLVAIFSGMGLLFVPRSW